MSAQNAYFVGSGTAVPSARVELAEPDACVKVAKLNNGWTFETSPVAEPVHPQTVEGCLEAVSTWCRHAPHEETWIKRQHGVPAAIVGVKYSFDPLHPRVPQVISVTPMPHQVGIAATLSGGYRERLLGLLKNSWPKFRYVSPVGHRSDDELWLGNCRLTVDEAHRVGGGTLFMVRTGPFESLSEVAKGDFHRLLGLEALSLGPIRTLHDNSYGVGMGLWKKVVWQGISDNSKGQRDGMVAPPLPTYPNAYALRPLSGTGGYAIQLVASENQRPARRHKGDFAGPKRAASIVASMKPAQMYVQPYIAPTRLPQAEDRNVVFRMDFAFDPKVKGYKPLGGMWLGNHSAIVLMGSKTRVGALQLPD